MTSNIKPSHSRATDQKFKCVSAMFASSCLKIAQAAVWKQCAQKTIRWLLVQEVSWTFVVSAPRFGGCPTHHQGKDRETKLRHGEGHSEIPTCGTMLLLVLCRPLGTDGLTSWGAHNGACPAAWADTATVHCGIKLKYFRWKDTQCPFPKWWGTQSSPELDLLPGAGHQLSQGLPARSLSRQIAARGFKLFA